MKISAIKTFLILVLSLSFITSCRNNAVSSKVQTEDTIPPRINDTILNVVLGSDKISALKALEEQGYTFKNKTELLSTTNEKVYWAGSEFDQVSVIGREFADAIVLIKYFYANESDARNLYENTKKILEEKYSSYGVTPPANEEEEGRQTLDQCAYEDRDTYISLSFNHTDAVNVGFLNEPEDWYVNLTYSYSDKRGEVMEAKKDSIRKNKI